MKTDEIVGEIESFCKDMGTTKPRIEIEPDVTIAKGTDGRWEPVDLKEAEFQITFKISTNGKDKDET